MKNYTLLICAAIALLCSSCTINTNLMLKTDKEYEYAELTDSVISAAKAYTLAPADLVQFRLYDNDAWMIINGGISTVTQGNNNQQNRALFNPNNQLSYLIENDSTCKLPILGRIKLAGLTVREAEDTLESLYSEYYKYPYVQITVRNKRVIVFPGNGSNAQVVQLVNNNTTLMEALAYANGIASRGRAANIKLMRNVNGQRVVYQIDLSTIEGLKYTDMLVQANDYIYVEPVPEIGREILQDIAPIISLLSSSLVVYSVARTFNN